MKRLLPLLICVWVLPIAAAPKGDWKDIDVTLEEGQVFEHCAAVAAGGKRRYHWKSNAPVDFNIHYHEDPEVLYPVKRDGMRGDGGTFTARKPQEYCWMWTGRKTTAHVEGQVEIKPE